MDIKLTPTEAEIADWAIGPMEEYGEELEEHDPECAWGSEAVPVLTGKLLNISATTPSSLDDLLSRINHQYPDIVDESEGDYFYWEYVKKGMDDDRARSAAKSKARREYAAIDSLTRKIKKASPFN